MDRLEITVNSLTGVTEAPLQLKSNCGILVLDDFGRQRVSTEELLNRWIVPLDRRHDFLNLPSGKTIQVPFDQILVFSTNLEPKSLVDEAFLRRIPYKIEVLDPRESEFRQLFMMYAERLGCVYSDEVLTEVIQKFYTSQHRAFRACHARDLLLQIRNFCEFNGLPVEMTADSFDRAVGFAARGRLVSPPGRVRQPDGMKVAALPIPRRRRRP
jgi:predicted ATPase with chaperone activity